MPAALPLLAIADSGPNAPPSTDGRATAEEWADRGKKRSTNDGFDSALDVWVDLVKYVATTLRGGGCNSNSEPEIVDDGSTKVCEFEDDLHYCKFFAQMAICSSAEITEPPEASITVRVRARLDENEPGTYSSQLMLRHRQLEMQSTDNAITSFGLTLGLILGNVFFPAVAVVFLSCLLFVICGYSANLALRANERKQISKDHANEAKWKLLDIVQKNLKGDVDQRAMSFWTDHRTRVTAALLEETGAAKIDIKDTQYLPSFVPRVQDSA